MGGLCRPQQSAGPDSREYAVNATQTVVLVHGLWVHAGWMRFMRRRLERCGYRVFCFSYPSMRCTLSENAARLSAYCAELPGDALHLVGHSLGGLVVLHAAAHHAPARGGRIVLAGTPVRESFSARRLSRLPGGRALLGKCARELLREAHGPERETGEWSGREIGVIAGDLSFGLGRVIAPDLPAPNDGVVRVGETRVRGMRDQIVLHVSHTAMLFAASVAREACSFLRHGHFSRDAARIP
jgi:pimeloyl-ACP methyl ester carboxylesterase